MAKVITDSEAYNMYYGRNRLADHTDSYNDCKLEGMTHEESHDFARRLTSDRKQYAVDRMKERGYRVI